jgi:renalase
MRAIRTVAVIGAGIAGLAAARRLHDAGKQVFVFEKSRSVGGRMATRREAGTSFDHGAQYFTCHGRILGEQLERWKEEGIVAHWPPQGMQGRADGTYVGVPGMTAPARMLADGLVIVAERTIRGINPADGGWRLTDESGAVSTAGIDRFDAVVLAVPAPQAAPLIAASGVALPGAEIAVYAPCWALMLATGREAADLPEAFSPEDGAISWVARNSAKPGRPTGVETLVVHASPDWSRAHLEESPAEVARLLLQRLAACTHRLYSTTFATAHRWRYAMVERALGEPFLWNSEAGLGACGDWCLGARVEAAFDSGAALATAVLGEPPLALGRDARR